MSQIILGTAGHIDHGKTALIKALTGIDLDRLKEEKERGITIELGFASLSLAFHQTIGVVDVPGHERFVKRMVAGAGGIDIVLLVIAADDGVMPQTREHFDICQLLGIKRGLIAVTKTDLVEPEWLELVKDDITRLVRGTFLENAPIVPVSSVTGEGIPHLLSALEQIVPAIAEKRTDGFCFMPIDRIFTMKGFGTVVTGTLLSGTITVGDTVEVLPNGYSAKVRGIQVYNAAVETSLAGQRTAVNLQGLEKASLKRGDILSYPDELRPTNRLDARLELLPGAPYPLKHGGGVRLHLFTMQTPARIISYEGNILEPGGSYFVQFRFPEPVVSIPGARFVVRNLDATRTVGGGQILCCHPPRHRRNDPATLRWFRVLQDKDVAIAITTLATVCGHMGITQKELLRQVDVPVQELDATWQDLLNKKLIVEIAPDSHRIIHHETLLAYERNVETILKAFHHNNPLKPGMLLEETKHRSGLDGYDKFFDFLIQTMQRNRILTITGDTIRHASHAISLTPEQTKLKAEITSLLTTHGLTPPTFRDLVTNCKVSPGEVKNLLELMSKEKTVTKINEDLFFAQSHIAELTKKVVQHLKVCKELTPASFKEMTGISRKYLIPLLEYFDKEKITIRIGDKRILRERKRLE
ncbi:MAG: selenocysteine-specific translation elongation factor [Deltaproteobacteria bacterium]|nr:selenocysteine-specific translation elongation factor [Deltaproteobacteria bacterium]